MILKDASSYNIQFYRGKPIFIDICSFTIRQEGMPWLAYKQFCQHFLAPLALMAKKDIRLGLLTKQYIDGIPLDLASCLLPVKSKLSLSLFLHLHVHAKFQQKFKKVNCLAERKRKMSRMNILALLDNLQSLISQLKWSPSKTQWSHYYNETNYSAKATQHKISVVRQFIEKINPHIVWDLGSNNGFYSKIIADPHRHIVCFDLDPLAVEMNYLNTKKENLVTLLPLLQDLTNPSTAIGWAELERDGLARRGPADMIMALALIHHLAISNNIPLQVIAEYFCSLGNYLIVEFVSKEDTQVQLLLASRQDIFFEYDIQYFKKFFSSFYYILEEIPIIETERTIFLMKKRKVVNA